MNNRTFSLECRKTKNKVIILAKADDPMNQSEREAKTRNRRKARKNVCEQES